jgi:hypothetical protein
LTSIAYGVQSPASSRTVHEVDGEAADDAEVGQAPADHESLSAIAAA